MEKHIDPFNTTAPLQRIRDKRFLTTNLILCMVLIIAMPFLSGLLAGVAGFLLWFLAVLYGMGVCGVSA